jgi:hypothetical protein
MRFSWGLTVFGADTIEEIELKIEEYKQNLDKEFNVEEFLSI